MGVEIERVIKLATYKEYKTTKGTFWRVSGYLGINPTTGQQVNINKRGFTSKREAMLYFSEAVTNLEKNIYDVKSSSKTYKQVYEEWLEQYKQDVKESTYHQMITSMNKDVLPYIGNLKIDKIQPVKIQQLLNDWHKRYANYKKMYWRMLKPFEYALKHGYIHFRIEDRITIPKDKRIKADKKQFYTKDELQELLSCMEQNIKPIWYVFFRLLAFTGMRKGEALALTWKDINFSSKTIDINKTFSIGLGRKQIIQTPKTNSGIRVITVDNKTLEILNKWKITQAKLLLERGFNALNDTHLIFTSFKDNKFIPLEIPSYWFNKFCNKNGFDIISIHGFRHTHCSLLFESGVPMKDVQERLGHSDIQTTMNIYTHVTENSRENSAKLFANYVGF